MTTRSQFRKASVATAQRQIGKPYRWGAVGPHAFDCSGLILYCFRQAGAKLPRLSARRFQEHSNCVPVKRSELAPGDLVFYGRPATHMGIWIGAGYMIDASGSRMRVMRRKPWATPTSYGRLRSRFFR